jgi:acyl transferase domain-containing protein/acyl carrier protein
MSDFKPSDSAASIAIIGMSGRFPGANDLTGFWQNLLHGKESIARFSDEEVASAGVGSEGLKSQNYVKAGAILDDVSLFDASFFDFYPREAELIDPQQRLFLECSWEALENAGYDPERYDGLIGVFAGAGINLYLINNILKNREILDTLDLAQLLIYADKDFLPTRVAYKLNLKGPGILVQSACSTSLLAVHLACQSLMTYESDMALAGGATIRVPQKQGYRYQEGGILSPDGHCRAFDAKANGTVPGNGVGVVILKRLEDALADRDTIRAVIIGSAINNDGAMKVGYTAPGLSGQAEVIGAAQANAGIDVESIGYIEAHGTGTPIGDPIELAALDRVFRAATTKKGFCSIGSVKANVGHLDTAAGVAGLIKTVLMLEHKTLPPLINFARPNPESDLENSPFYFTTKPVEWRTGGSPRRAGVSSFGIGGTNAHVIVEEAPVAEATEDNESWKLLPLSAKSRSSLEAATANLAHYLEGNAGVNLADVAYTLQVGRKAFVHRRIALSRNIEEALHALESNDPDRVFTSVRADQTPFLVFMFPGQGSQYLRMASGIYETEPDFRERVDYCSEYLERILKLELRKLIYPDADKAGAAAALLDQTQFTQSALFVIEYSLASFLMRRGVRPQAFVGHSIGEYVAACLAGTFSLEDALEVVAARGLLMQQMPEGAMISVALSEAEARRFLSDGLYLAAVNGPNQSVISGAKEAVRDLESTLIRNEITCRPIRTSHAFHSGMIEPIVAAFVEQVKRINLRPPKIPYLSNLTGGWISDEEAIDPSYWGRHLRQTVRFSDNIRRLLDRPNTLILEVGPGQALCTLARQHFGDGNEHLALNSTRRANEVIADEACLMKAIGKLWLAGVPIDWPSFHAGEKRRRIPLPTYSFERQHYWIDPSVVEQESDAGRLNEQARSNTPNKKLHVADWFYVPGWKEAPLFAAPEASRIESERLKWLIFADDCGVGAGIARRLESEGHESITVLPGAQFERAADSTYIINPESSQDYDTLIAYTHGQENPISSIVYLWGVTGDKYPPKDAAHPLESSGLYGLLSLAQSIRKHGLKSNLRLFVITDGAQSLTGEEGVCPEKASLLAGCKVISQELLNISCCGVDIVVSKPGATGEERLIDQLMLELTSEPSHSTVVYRHNRRWAQRFEAVRLGDDFAKNNLLRRGGTYLITGGTGRLGLLIAEYLATNFEARLILMTHSSLPSRDCWEEWLGANDRQNAISKKIKKIQALESLGAEVLVIKADVADREEMIAALSLPCAKFGKINGVIHAAGLVGGQWLKPLERLTPLDFQSHYRPKAQGLYLIEEFFHEDSLDFCLAFSSLSSVLGGPGYMAYAAANLITDAFMQRQYRAGRHRRISVNWDAWHTDEDSANPNSVDLDWLQPSMTNEEGVEAFKRVLALVGSCPQVAVSTTDLNVRIGKWINPGLSEALPQKRAEEAHSPQPSRAGLSADYIAPDGETQRRICELWQERLGISAIGAQDNFFELGGDSLAAVPIISRLQDIFGVNIPLRRFFEAPTVAALARLVTELRDEKEEDDKLEILKLLDGLSDDAIDEEFLKRGLSTEN